MEHNRVKKTIGRRQSVGSFRPGRGFELGTTGNKSSKMVRTGLEPGRPRFLVRRADHSPVFRGVHICTTEWRGMFLVYDFFFHK